MSTMIDKSTRVAILGGTSFAGAALRDYCTSIGAAVLVISRQSNHRNLGAEDGAVELALDLRWHTRDMVHALLEWNAEYVFDFMGQGMVEPSWDHPRTWYETNVAAKAEVLDGLRRSRSLIKYIRASTPEVYGSSGKPIRESQPFAPSTPYAVSHASIDLHLRSMNQRFNFPSVIARFANFYGPGQQAYRLIPKLMLCLELGRTFTLHGNGNSERAFIYRSDFVDALMACAKYGTEGEEYHFSPLRTLTIREVVDQVCAIYGAPEDTVIQSVEDRPSKDRRYHLDSTKSRSLLSWEDRVPLSQGLCLTREWVKSNADDLSLEMEYVFKA